METLRATFISRATHVKKVKFPLLKKMVHSGKIVDKTSVWISITF